MKTTDQNLYWLIFQNDCLLMTKDGISQPIHQSTLETLSPFFLRQFEVGQFHNKNYACAEISSEATVPEEFECVGLRKALVTAGHDWYGIIVKAYSIINWDRNHQFCSRCGTPTLHKQNTFERACPACGLLFYPRISPSIIVLIKKEEEYILLARSPHFAPLYYSLIAGFIEIGESLEDAIFREVKEEVGIEIKNLQYIYSQPWPFPDSLMIGFIADYAAGDILIDNKEIEDAGWYHYTKLPEHLPPTISIARKLIDHYLAQMKQKTLK